MTDIKLTEVDNLVTKSNELIKACYRLSLIEMQLILYGISLINPLNKEFPKFIDVKISEFSALFNKNIKSVYSELKNNVLNNFWQKDIRFSKNDLSKVRIRWLSFVEYHENKGKLVVCFSEHVRPYLHMLSKNFTSYHIKEVSDLRSVHSLRFYEIFIMELNKSKQDKYNFILSVNFIKEKLDLLDKYPRYYSLKERVLTRAKTEINTHSDLMIDFEEIKNGRSVEKIKFTIQRKEGAKPARYQRIEETKELDITSKPVLPTAEEMAQEMSKESMKERLINFGITEKVANQFIQKYSDRYIEQHIDYTINKMKQGSVTNSAAFLVDSINHGYAT